LEDEDVVSETVSSSSIETEEEKWFSRAVSNKEHLTNVQDMQPWHSNYYRVDNRPRRGLYAVPRLQEIGSIVAKSEELKHLFDLIPFQPEHPVSVTDEAMSVDLLGWFGKGVRNVSDAPFDHKKQSVLKFVHEPAELVGPSVIFLHWFEFRTPFVLLSVDADGGWYGLLFLRQTYGRYRLLTDQFGCAEVKEQTRDMTTAELEQLNDVRRRCHPNSKYDAFRNPMTPSQALSLPCGGFRVDKRKPANIHKLFILACQHDFGRTTGDPHKKNNFSSNLAMKKLTAQNRTGQVEHISNSTYSGMGIPHLDMPLELPKSIVSTCTPEDFMDFCNVYVTQVAGGKGKRLHPDYSVVPERLVFPVPEPTVVTLEDLNGKLDRAKLRQMYYSGIVLSTSSPDIVSSFSCVEAPPILQQHVELEQQQPPVLANTMLVVVRHKRRFKTLVRPDDDAHDFSEKEKGKKSRAEK
jgi:hypothetical protein